MNDSRRSKSSLHFSGNKNDQNLNETFDECIKNYDRVLSRIPQARSALTRKEMITVVGNDNNLRQSCGLKGRVKVYPSTWNENDFKKIKMRSTFITKEERLAALECREAERNRLKRESEERKNRLKEIDKTNRQKLKQCGKTEVECENQMESKKIFDRVMLAYQEQQEEVKHANALILSTKCQIIRDAQIAEKNEIQRELRVENLKIEKMINDECEKMMQIEKKAQDERRKLMEQHACELKKQLKYREMLKELEAERIEEEAKMIARAQIMVTQDIIEREKERKAKVMKIRADLQKSNELSEHFKRLEFEEQRIADLKIQEYTAQKREREKNLQKEKQVKREQEERERERLLNLQKQLLDTKSEQHEMGMRREQEEKERDFRRKEKEAALKRKKQIKELEIARQQQLEEMKQQKALEIARNETEHSRVVKQIESSLEEDKRKAEMRKIKNDKYRTDIINQMNEREKNRRELKERSKEEYYLEKQKEQERAKMVCSVLNRKIQNMKANHVPERFIKDVERRIYYPVANQK